MSSAFDFYIHPGKVQQLASAQHGIWGRFNGLMQAIELVKDRETKEPAPQAVLKVFEETKRRGVLIGKGGLYGNVIRTGVMLNATKDTIDELITALDTGFASVTTGA